MYIKKHNCIEIDYYFLLYIINAENSKHTRFLQLKIFLFFQHKMIKKSFFL